MNTKQWTFIYGMIRKFFLMNSKIPDKQTADEVMNLYEFVMKRTEKDRAKNPKMDEQITNMFDYLFKLIHAAEQEQKPL